MSVTFHIAGAGFKYMCDSYCESCEQCRVALAHERENEMNVSNANARDILDALAITVTDELCGEIYARELIKRADAVLSRPLDAARMAFVEGNFMDFGRPAGYVHGRVSQLRELAVRAGDLGRITFG